MRNTPLGAVRLMMKAEAAKSLQSSSTAQDNEINQIISDTQAGLAGQFDWPFLKTRWDSFINAGTRYQSFPLVSNLNTNVLPNLERPCEAWVKWNMVWQPVLYGIDEYPEFNYLDSDRAQVLDPVQRWQFSDQSNFEVWPIPASQAQVRFVGQRMVGSLANYTYTSSGCVAGTGDTSSNGNWQQAVNATGTYYVNTTSGNRYMHFLPTYNCWIINQSATDTTLASALYVSNVIISTWTLGTFGANSGFTSFPTFVLNSQNAWNDSALLDLDDVLVALFSAAEYLTRKESAVAPGVLAAANRRLLAQRAAYPTRTETICIGRGEPLGRKAIRQVPLVLVAGK